LSLQINGHDSLTIVFRYREIRMRGFAADALLQLADPGVWALAPLAEGGHRRDVLERVVAAIEGAPVSEEQRNTLRVSIWVFAGLVGAGRMIERLLDMRGLRESPVYKQILDEGRAEGEAKALSRVLRVRLARLGRRTRALTRRLESVTDVSELRRLVDIALDVDTLEDFTRRAFPRGTH
jgi:predicted transposase YdaD